MHEDLGAPSSLEPTTLEAGFCPELASAEALSPAVRTIPPPGPLGLHRGLWAVLLSAAATLVLLAVYTVFLPSPSAAVVVGTAEPGARLYVDGEDHGPVPALAEGLAPGEHVIRIGGPGADRSFVRRVTLVPGQLLELAPRREPARSGLTRLDGEHGSAERAASASRPTSPEHEELPVAAPAGPAHAAEAASTSPAREAVPVVKPAELPRAHEPARRWVAASGAASPASTVAEQGSGLPGAEPQEATLSVNSLPPATVLLNGRPIGSTPMRTRVKPGRHRVTFFHPELGRRSVTVDVVSHGQNVAAVRF